eukprot:9451289-Alexandrium_andersonii.AAC.1
MSASLVGSEMCIRDRALARALAPMLPRGARRHSRLLPRRRWHRGARGRRAARPAMPAGIERGPKGRQRRPGFEPDGWPAPRDK